MSETTTALGPQELILRPEPLGFTAHDIRALFHNPDFQAISDRDSQMALLEQCVPGQCYVTINDKELSAKYGISVDSVRKIHCFTEKNTEFTPAHIGSQFALTGAQKDEILRNLLARAPRWPFSPQGQVSRQNPTDLRKALTYGWVSGLLLRHRDGLMTDTIHPQESLRLKILRLFRDEYLSLVRTKVCDIDFPIERISTRRRNVRWRFINSEVFPNERADWDSVFISLLSEIWSRSRTGRPEVHAAVKCRQGNSSELSLVCSHEYRLLYIEQNQQNKNEKANEYRRQRAEFVTTL
jgi:hypothetical protein